MINRNSKDDNLFFQRLDELCNRCVERYAPQFTHFLDGRALNMASEYLKKYEHDVLVLKYGGFNDAERCVIGMFPRDIFGNDMYSQDELFSYFEIKAVVIKGSGFSKFSHRDCMGSILALGIKRESMGDIYVSDDETNAYVCLSDVAAIYISENLQSVSRDKVKVSIGNVSELPELEKKFVEITGTLASERLDCVVALSLNMSREKAKSLIVSGLVSVNHFEETKCDVLLCEGDLLSIRGFGRFKLALLGGLTKKGRNKAVIHKMI